MMKRLLAAIAGLALVAGSAIAQQGQAVGPPSLRSKVISTTKDMTQASGNVGYTGFGFQPTSCMATAANAGAATATGFISVLGFVDSALTSASSFVFGSAWTTTTNFISMADASAVNAQAATVVSYDADGLTLAWVKVGSPTGTATIKFICFR